MTQKLDDQTKAVVDRALEHPIFRSRRTKNFDKAWKVIQDDPQLERARAVLSIHELRQIIQHTADAFELY